MTDDQLMLVLEEMLDEEFGPQECERRLRETEKRVNTLAAETSDSGENEFLVLALYTAWKRQCQALRLIAARKNTQSKERGESMNYQKNGANQHSHTEPQRHFMQAKRSDVEHLIGSTNARMAGRAMLVLEGTQIFMMCQLCEQPIAITDVEFLPEDGNNSC